ncbi:hypothetical protein [Hymenobacter sp.]|uniref:hypothetical protein n=1 Tax=Hymenobacter sp. TaxID=1898978 RepID=UPI002D7F9241|nr:hypothetical protein [Hymenobacter sp.]
MKTTDEPGTIGAPIIIHNPELNKEDNAALFPEKMEKAREIIARAGLPNLESQINNRVR